MIYIGIDPGLRSGAIGAVDHDGKFVGVSDIPAIDNSIDVRGLKNLILQMTVPGDDYMICIEQVWTLPKQGLVSSGRFMKAYGAISAVAELLCENVVYAAPQAWKRIMNLTSAKEDSLIAARLAFPQAILKLKKDHGKAEALLLAEYARRMYS